MSNGLNFSGQEFYLQPCEVRNKIVDIATQHGGAFVDIWRPGVIHLVPVAVGDAPQFQEDHPLFSAEYVLDCKESGYARGVSEYMLVDDNKKSTWKVKKGTWYRYEEILLMKKYVKANPGNPYCSEYWQRAYELGLNRHDPESMKRKWLKIQTHGEKDRKVKAYDFIKHERSEPEREYLISEAAKTKVVAPRSTVRRVKLASLVEPTPTQSIETHQIPPMPIQLQPERPQEIEVEQIRSAPLSPPNTITEQTIVEIPSSPPQTIDAPILEQTPASPVKSEPENDSPPTKSEQTISQNPPPSIRRSESESKFSKFVAFCRKLSGQPLDEMYLLKLLDENQGDVQKTLKMITPE